MDFLSSPVHSYSYETFDDAFFELPKEMDFEVNDELRDGVSYAVDEDDDLNDGMYGVWNAKHPWSVNNNSASIYSSNLHLDFIGKFVLLITSYSIVHFEVLLLSTRSQEVIQSQRSW